MASKLGKFEWLEKLEGLPKMVVEALKLFGTLEEPGSKDNPTILAWAKELGLKDYSHDSIAWCGLFMAITASRAGKTVPKDPLWALNWKGFGDPVSEPMLGDVIILTRNGGGHVTLYVGEDDNYFYCLGGNQTDQVNITKIPKSRNHWVRRPSYKIGTPIAVKKYYVKDGGVAVSTKES